ncbi:MAG TPA: mechanosensitive ion channel domain-containing protein [Pirellulales bacterium]|nr:mechanosensitive ion channel domain-containing protein [Pirellulales bacterium]
MLTARQRSLLFGWLLLWGAADFATTRGEPPSDPSAPSSPDDVSSAKALPEVTVHAIESRIAEIKAAPDLDDSAKAAILAVYHEAQSEIERTAALVEQTARFKRALRLAPGALAKVCAELSKPPSGERAVVPIDSTTTQLEARLAEILEKLDQAQEELTRVEAEPQRRNERRLKGIPEQIYAASKAIAEIDAEASQARAEDSQEMADARRALLAARRQALAAEILCCTSERDRDNAEDELLLKQRDLAAQRVGELKQLAEAWQDTVRAWRRREADARVKRAELDMRGVYPALRAEAEENEALARRLTQIDNDVARTTRRAVEFASARADLDRAFQGLTKKVELGLAQQLGPYLLQYRVDLLRKRRELESSRLSQSQIDAARQEWLDLTDERNWLSDVDQACDELVRELGPPGGASQARLRAEALRLLESRKEIVDTLINASEHYIREMGPLTAADKELFDAFDRQLDYIDERIFWVRSTAPLSAGDLAAAGNALRWYTRPRPWQAVARQFVRGAAARPLRCAGGAVLFAALVAAEPFLRRRLNDLGAKAARGAADNMLVTFRALALTLLMASPWPAGVAFVGWLLGQSPGGSELSQALARGLGFTAPTLALFEFLRQACHGQGLATAHFAWPERSTLLLRRQLRWFMPIAIPLTLLGATTHALDSERWQSLARLNFIAAMPWVSLLIYRLFRPKGGVFQEFLARRRGTWLERVHHAVFVLAVASPLALAVLAGMGYFYTARQLAWRFQASGWLLAIFLMSGALLLRWLLIVRRRLSMRGAGLRSLAAQEARQGDHPATAEPEDEFDLATLNTQTRRFVETTLVVGFAVGLGWIWADVLPALSLLNVPLWFVEGRGGAAQLEPVKVTHLLEAVLVVILTAVATRNIPGFVEIVLLQRLSLEAATRYAVTTLFRYAIVVAGIVVACLAVGITWSKIHWLVAAVSVGLGFGLQEIFANFISGLIILCERPIRVGDIVTVDDVSGTVSRIRIRATMITDFDRKELVVPNKEFITGRLLNWTLSDPVNRICLNVGIAYGSDIEKARSLLLQVAAETPGVLKEPAPIASFESFGDSALNLVLRVCLPNPDLENRLAAIHALNTKIHDTFRAEGIDIAFPQLDLHVHGNPAGLYQRKAA